jgi:hypothetical protein
MCLSLLSASFCDLRHLNGSHNIAKKSAAYGASQRHPHAINKTSRYILSGAISSSLLTFRCTIAVASVIAPKYNHANCILDANCMLDGRCILDGAVYSSVRLMQQLTSALSNKCYFVCVILILCLQGCCTV